MNKVAEFKDRLKLAIDESGLSNYKISQQCEFSRSLLTRYLQGVYEPNAEKILSLARVLNVSPTWLMGYDVEKNYKDVKSIQTSEEAKIKNEIYDLLDKTYDPVLLEKIKIIIETMIN